MTEYLETHKVNGLYADPSSNWDSPVAAKYSKPGEKQGTWDAMANHPDMTRRFAVSLRMCDVLVQPTTIFDFKQLANNSDRKQLVDIGGGYGDVLNQILDAFPDLDPQRCVLQDIEPVIAIADAARKKGVMTQVIDFHKEQPVTGIFKFCRATTIR